jgi:hypothetical protein
MSVIWASFYLFVILGNVPPMNILDKNDIKTVMHFAKVCAGVERLRSRKSELEFGLLPYHLFCFVLGFLWQSSF